MTYSTHIDTIFQPFSGTHTPGCAVAVVRAGDVEFARGYGMADLERSVVISPHTVFDIGSTSKQFTAASVLLLAHDRKLSLDDEVRHWIPALPDYGVSLTIRHLIHHTSGLRDYLTLMIFGGRRIENQYSPEEVIALIARQQALDFPPGSRFSYSNTGYFLLGEIVRIVSGQTLRQFAHERIFAPLGMRHTLFRDDLNELIPHRAQAFSQDAHGAYRIDMSIMDIVGDGAVHTTVGDLATWDHVFYEPDVLPDGASVLPAMLLPGRLNDGKELEYAAGLMHGSHHGSRTIAHGGAWGGYRAEMLRLPDHRLTIIVLCNLGSMHPSELALQVADAVLGSEFEPATDSEETPTVMPDLQPWLGLYADSESRMVLELRVGKDGPEVSLASQQFLLQAAGPDRMSIQDTGLELELGPHGTMSLDLRSGPPLQLQRLIEPLPERLTAYAGRYYSSELDAVYEVVEEDGTLRLRAGFMSWGDLRPAGGDVFAAESGNLLFQRRDDSIDGFLLSSLRAAGIRFQRTDGRAMSYEP